MGSGTSGFRNSGQGSKPGQQQEKNVGQLVNQNSSAGNCSQQMNRESKDLGFTSQQGRGGNLCKQSERLITFRRIDQWGYRLRVLHFQHLTSSEICRTKWGDLIFIGFTPFKPLEALEAHEAFRSVEPRRLGKSSGRTQAGLPSPARKRMGVRAPFWMSCGGPKATPQPIKPSSVEFLFRRPPPPIRPAWVRTSRFKNKHWLPEE